MRPRVGVRIACEDHRQNCGQPRSMRSGSAEPRRENMQQRYSGPPKSRDREPVARELRALPLVRQLEGPGQIGRDARAHRESGCARAAQARSSFQRPKQRTPETALRESRNPPAQEFLPRCPTQTLESVAAAIFDSLTRPGLQWPQLAHLYSSRGANQSAQPPLLPAKAATMKAD